MSTANYPVPPTRQRVEFQGSSYLVCAERIGAAIRVWIERAEEPGTVWHLISEGVDVLPPECDASNEFAVELEREGETPEQITLLTGWFQRTGGAISRGGRRRPIWRLSEASPLRAGRSSYFDSLGLPALMRHWAEALRMQAVTAIILTAPDAFSTDAGRTVVAGYSETLRDTVAGWGSDALMSSKDRSHPAAEWGEINTAPYVATTRLKSLGYGAWISVRLPAAAGDHLEAIMLGNRALLNDNRPEIATATALNLIGPVRRAIAAQSLKITMRERECLLYADLTVKEAALQLGCAEKTVHYHRGNVMAKLKAKSTLQALLRAQKLGVFD